MTYVCPARHTCPYHYDACTNPNKFCRIIEDTPKHYAETQESGPAESAMGYKGYTTNQFLARGLAVTLVALIVGGIWGRFNLWFWFVVLVIAAIGLFWYRKMASYQANTPKEAEA